MNLRSKLGSNLVKIATAAAIVAAPKIAEATGEKWAGRYDVGVSLTTIGDDVELYQSLSVQRGNLLGKVYQVETETITACPDCRLGQNDDNTPKARGEVAERGLIIGLEKYYIIGDDTYEVPPELLGNRELQSEIISNVSGQSLIAPVGVFTLSGGLGLSAHTQRTTHIDEGLSPDAVDDGTDLGLAFSVGVGYTYRGIVRLNALFEGNFLNEYDNVRPTVTAGIRVPF